MNMNEVQKTAVRLLISASIPLTDQLPETQSSGMHADRSKEARAHHVFTGNGHVCNRSLF